MSLSNAGKPSSGCMPGPGDPFLLETLINAVEDFLFLFDTDERIVFAGKAAEEFSGKGLKDLFGKRIENVLPGANELSTLIRKVLMEGRTIRKNRVEIPMSPAVMAVSAVITPYYAGNDLCGALLSLREISLIPDDEGVSFESLFALLGTIAHEIKNPLGGLRGAAQILNEAVTEEEHRESLTFLLRETDRLNRILNEYLTLTGKPSFHPLNIHEIIEHAIRVMNPLAKELHVAVVKRYDPSLPDICGDEGRLLQVFVNLIKNALESMDGSKRTRILTFHTTLSHEYVVESGTDEHGRKGKKRRLVIASVADTGKGMTEREVSRLFQPFITGKKGGSGFGLAVSRKIIHDHRGFIRTQSEAGKGSLFSVYLPCGCV